MSNYMKFCGCRGCREGMHRGKGPDETVKKASRKFRYQTKDAIRKGEEPPDSISVSYTD